MSLSAKNLLDMYCCVNLQDRDEVVKWYSLMFSFRTLLRKLNIFPEKLDEPRGHIVLRGDISQTDYGMCVSVYSTKTLKH